jgi:rhamnopyranosyl-N-acetylglucosaminyl-diphospho-decaprenol beta-1,3/1,4-galactofuranosyltransferase
MNISAVVVTYNRFELLVQCINSLRKQSTKLNKIIVINNGSTDNTLEWLKHQNDLLVINQNNLGGAGGFSRGLEEALKYDSDWFWIMDDDVEATTDCLTNLIQYSVISECIHPLRLYSDGQIVEWEQFWNFESDEIIKLKNKSFEFDKDFCVVNVGCFEGMLISRNIVLKIGLPDKRFFITYDDTIYGYLASLHTNVLYVKSAQLIRKKIKSDEKITPAFVYYSTRNKHLILDYIKLYSPSSDLNKIKVKYFINELKQILFTIFNPSLNFNLKKIYIKMMIKGKIDFYKKRTGIKN